MPDETTNIVGIEQGRANFAFQCAEEGSVLPKKKEYKSYVKSIPMMIKTNGIGAAFAFMHSKHGTYDKIGEHIYNWLKKDPKKIIDLNTLNSFADLTNKTVELNSTDYRMLTNEVLAFLSWLRRFADGMIRESNDGEE